MLVYLQMIELDDDKTKFENIYLAYKDMMFNIAMDELKNAQKAEDLVHDVFIKIAENIKKIEPVSKMTRQLMITMVNNRVIDIYRSRNEQLTTVDSRLIVKATEELLHEPLISECIFKLPEKQRDLIWYKYVHGYKNKELSQMLGVTIAWIQKNEQKAKRTLAELFKAEGGQL